MASIYKRVIVLGGGIGGLCTAISLRQIGLDVVVYEQAEELCQVGAGLTIWANAIKALDALDARRVMPGVWCLSRDAGY